MTLFKEIFSTLFIWQNINLGTTDLIQCTVYRGGNKKNARTLSQCDYKYMTELVSECKVHIHFIAPRLWSYCLSHSDVPATCKIPPPISINITVTYQILRKNFLLPSNREVFEKEGLSIPTETQQRFPTLATHRAVFSNREEKCAKSTRQCGNDHAAFLEVLIPSRGSTAWTVS